MSKMYKELESEPLGSEAISRATSAHPVWQQPYIVPQEVWADNAPSELQELQDVQIARLKQLGVITTTLDGTRSHNIGGSNYSKHLLQPWAIWEDHNLNPWDADIIKRILRSKVGDSRKLDYKKVIHICQERIRQLGETSDD